MHSQGKNRFLRVDRIAAGTDRRFFEKVSRNNRIDQQFDNETERKDARRADNQRGKLKEPSANSDLELQILLRVRQRIPKRTQIFRKQVLNDQTGAEKQEN